MPQDIDNNYRFADAVVKTIHEPLMVLDKNLIVQRVNSAFLDIFNLKEGGVVGSKISKIDKGTFNNPHLIKCLQELSQKDKSIKEFELENIFHSTGYKNLILNAQKINVDKLELILLAIEDVTLERKLETDLSKQVNLLNQVSEAVITTDLNGFTILSWNKAAEKMFGYTKQEAIGKKVRDILNISYLYTTRDEAHKQLLKEGYWQGQAIHESKSGDKIYTLVSTSLIKNKKGEPTGSIGVIRDIQLQVEQQERLAFHSAIINSTAEAVYSKDTSGHITSWNEAAEKLYGYKEDEVIGKHINFLVPENLIKSLDNIRESVVRKGKSKRFETRRIKKDGSIIDIVLTLSPINNTHGKTIGLAALTHDITQRKQQEANLKFLAEASRVLSSSLNYEETLQQVAKLAVPEIADWCSIDIVNEDKSNIDQIAVAHKDPKKVEFAKKLRKINPVKIGDDSGAAIVIKTGKPIFHPYISDEDMKKLVKSPKQLKLIRKLGLSAVIVVPLKFHQKTIGAVTLVSAESKKHFTKNDLNIAEELSRRAVVAIENARLYEKELNAVKLREEFISVASHELKTPVTSLKVYSQVLQKKIKNNKLENIDKYFEKMDKQIDKLNILIADLLNVSRLKNGQLLFDVKEFDLNDVVKTTVDLLHPMADGHEINLKGKISKPVKGDEERVGQVIANLLNNAIKYSPNANKVNVIMRNNHDKASVTVEDFGIGIDEDKIDSLFERFYRVEGDVQDTFPGLGIGLYIANEIALRHGGEIKVKSKKGKGSKFTFLLPYSQNGVKSKG